MACVCLFERCCWEDPSTRAPISAAVALPVLGLFTVQCEGAAPSSGLCSRRFPDPSSSVDDDDMPCSTSMNIAI